VTNFLNLHDINIFTSDVVNPYIGNTVVGTVVPFSPVVGSNVQRGLLPSSTLPNVDAQAWEQVGKVSIGDLDISDDGRYLYLVNLYDRKVYEIDLVDPFNPQAPTLANVATRVKSWATPDPGTTAAQGEHRPFGLAYYRGELYVGTVLSAQNLTGAVVGTEADMSGYLHKTTPGTGTWQDVLSFPMSYRVEQDWYPWSNNAIAAYEIGTPMISDIAFYKNGEILIGIRDRWADQKGWFNYGVDGDFAGLGSIGEVGVSAGDLIRYNPVIQPDGSCLYTLISSGAANLDIDNILKVGILATNNNEVVTTYSVSVNGTTVTPSTGTYGIGQFFELGKGSGGTGATYIIVITDVVNGASCARLVPVTSPMTCTPAIEECETPKCGSSNIQVNGN